MTDIKKIAQISDDAIPEFPTSRRSGYVEDSVDKWLTEHYEELHQIIEYQNYCVDVAEKAEQERDEAQAVAAAAESKIADAVARAEAAEAQAAEAADIASQWEAAYNERVEQEASAPAAPAVAPVADTVEREAAEVSTLLQNATKLAREHIEQAKVDADKIRENAESELQDLRKEIERLAGERYAAFHTLSSFYTNELGKLVENPMFADLKETAAPETVEEPAVDLAVQESVALEEAEENGYELETPVEEDVTTEVVDVVEVAPDEEDDEEVVFTVVDDEDETQK